MSDKAPCENHYAVQQNRPPCVELPEDVLYEIFSLCACHVELPLFRKPFALALSHVCSSWRRAALATAELWNDVVMGFNLGKEPQIKWWLSYASRWPMSMRILGFPSDDELKHMIHSIFLRYRLRKLALRMSVIQLGMFFSEVTNETLEELELRCDNTSIRKFTPPLRSDGGPFPHLTSLHLKVILYTLDMRWFHHLTWNYLRHLTIEMRIPLSSLLQCLKQAPKLDSLEVVVAIDVDHHRPAEEIVLRQLSLLKLQFYGCETFDASSVLRHLIHPNLRILLLQGFEIQWNPRTFPDLLPPSNFNNLRRLNIQRYLRGAIPLDTVLKNVPQLRELLFPPVPSVNKKTLVGILTSELGPYLTLVGVLHCYFSPRQLLFLVKEHVRITDRTSQYTTAPIKRVIVRFVPNCRPGRECFTAFKELGIELKRY
ncbi:hypothetical protein AMATHDRAFT_69295 [Amanita thiersii Skay4041]|uniref:Uncharacterized protein n=1 Tax=Amanita thiersii Skay4041 TaxID=703135 RepID=A0A2A9NFX3_9AGAR|nr:hypothetical protein AMATHDRAFT_69295 [Amanita thiersii Skay4041]